MPTSSEQEAVLPGKPANSAGTVSQKQQQLEEETQQYAPHAHTTTDWQQPEPWTSIIKPCSVCLQPSKASDLKLAHSGPPRALRPRSAGMTQAHTMARLSW